jgi:hypothetical protein
MLLAQGKQDAALAEIDQESDAGYRAYSLARAYAVLGRRAESLAAVALVEKSFASNQSYNIATVHALLGIADICGSLWCNKAVCSAAGTDDCGRRGIKSFAMRPVQPVWCEAPTPRPLSP